MRSKLNYIYYAINYQIPSINTNKLNIQYTIYKF